MQAYINSIGIISSQKTYDGSFLEEPTPQSEDLFMPSIEPVYKEFINPVQLRRMSRILKMGLGASTICLNNSPEIKIDAVIVGTGLACISDLEKFLLSILNENEQSLSPIPFINSSHNTVAAQIAMNKRITGYNTTYCHRGASFENTLLDTLMLINEGEAKNVLAGGIDEYLQSYNDIFNMLDYWKGKDNQNCTKFGEGAAFFILSNNRNKNTYAQLSGIHTFVNPKNSEEIYSTIINFLEKHHLNIDEVDLLISGRNNNCVTDEIYDYVENKLIYKNIDIVYYKNLSGEYMTSTGFAMWMASNILKQQLIPTPVKVKRKNKQSYKNILIYNHYNNINHSLILLKK